MHDRTPPARRIAAARVTGSIVLMAGAARRPGLVAASRAGAAIGFACLAGPAAAFDWTSSNLLPSVMWFDPRSAIGAAILIGLIIFSVVLAVQHIRERRLWLARETGLVGEIAGLRSAGNRAELLLGAEAQVVVAWTGRDGEATIDGDPATIAGGLTRGRLLAFGAWLVPADAAAIDAALDRLRTRGEGFRSTLRTADGAFVEAEGRAVGGRALLRLRDVTGVRGDFLRMEGEATEARASARALAALLDASEEPAWLRGEDGRLRFVNRAYRAAVELGETDDLAARGLELLERSDRDEAARRRERGEIFRARVAAIVAGARRVLDIVETPLSGGSGGIARDVSEVEALKTDLQRQMQAHVRTLDQFPTAVAMFDASERLVFHNAAYRRLWGLDAPFLAASPTEGEILDRLRTARRLPEQADYRSWKAGVLEAYRKAEVPDSWWYLPSGKTLRVVANPNPQGGLTYLFDDVSERIHLESEYNSLTRTRDLTLNALAEGVALFGTNGRLQLFNRAFADLWRIEESALADGPHIEAVETLCRRLAPLPGPWDEVRGLVAGFSEMRLTVSVRMERLDGSILDCAAAPLPGGATLLTFNDVTASVNVERALTERNDALEAASRLRNDFVHHVDYQLRTPLQAIIGFTELMGAETTGPLNERQREYADLIMQSSSALHAIMNDILDLQSIDADTIELSREAVDIRATIDAAALGIGDRLAESRLTLVVDAPSGIGAFMGDAKRVRQILFNLLSNAVAFSSPGQTIRVLARRGPRDVVLSVSDQGSGIPEDVQARVFDRFEARPAGSRDGGAGLGLSIVRAFVELHGGRVELVSEPGRGTTVTCHFPVDEAPPPRMAAE